MRYNGNQDFDVEVKVGDVSDKFEQEALVEWVISKHVPCLSLWEYQAVIRRYQAGFRRRLIQNRK